MMITQATKALSRCGVWKGENVLYSGINNQVLMVQRRYKKTSTEDKKRCEENPKKSRKLLKLATAAVVGTTVAVIAAKYDDDFRDWTKEHCPPLDNLVKVVFQEEETYLESLDKAHKELSAWLKNVLYNIFKAERKGREPRVAKSGGGSDSEVCEEIKKPYKPPESAFALKSDEAEKTKPGQVPTEIKELKDLENSLGTSAQDTIQAFAAVVCALKEKGNLIDHLDQVISSNDSRIWEKLKKKGQDAVNNSEKAEKGVLNVKTTEKRLKSKLEDSTDLSDDIKTKATNNLKIVTNDVQKAKDNMVKEQENAPLAKRSWDKAKQARLYFSFEHPTCHGLKTITGLRQALRKEELETLFPNIWLNDEKLNIPPENFDPFIQNVIGDLQFLDKELAKLQTVSEGELNSALERYKANDPEASDDVVKAVSSFEESKEKRKRQGEMQKSVLTHKAKCEKNARQLMKQQTEVYSDLTSEAVKLKEREVERKMQQQLEEKLAQLRAEHKMEIAKMVGRIQGANEAIAQRGDKGKAQQENQQFWSAAQNLMAAVNPIGAGSKNPSEPKPLKNEITNVSKVKPEGDELVDSVLSTIPQQAVDQGIQSETALKEKFNQVVKEARTWAGVPPGEITLLQLLLARAQSALYLNPAIPQAELDNEPAIDPEELNNYDVLHRAKHYVDRGDFDQAIRYLNLLKGPSNKVASCWVQDALVFLETKQAAEVLLAHASAKNMQT